ncbi:class I SAM-dependent methyltransferase [Streptomyces qinzhouensis]|uniref:Class I SAM-dependent methyltransferase n=1 Tax=Streptomyces qinzhouensis TaxID=2599401 RepID=A0A5B8J5G8_9ACTN|nr:methyltransferase domain-containing protein [Streptomyces qinzhouensis]QDY75644.1 class I SAM-dependent methyltransferase [Streptomyces qinzhouensis]
MVTDARVDAWTGALYGNALLAGRGRLFLRGANGRLLPLELDRWCARADSCDLTVLSRCEGPVLDIGCGAGRLVEALLTQGHRALGIDVCASAVITTLRRGGRAHRASVFDPLPEEGRWGTALLIDGNIGIGGDPPRLLRRTRQLVRSRGLLLLETAAADINARHRVRIEDDLGNRGPAFPWASVGCRALLRVAPAAGWRVMDHWSTAQGRHFSALTALP